MGEGAMVFRSIGNDEYATTGDFLFADSSNVPVFIPRPAGGFLALWTTSSMGGPLVSKMQVYDDFGHKVGGEIILPTDGVGPRGGGLCARSGPVGVRFTHSAYQPARGLIRCR